MHCNITQATVKDWVRAGATAHNPPDPHKFIFNWLPGADTLVTPSFNHAGCVITTSGVFSFLFCKNGGGSTDPKTSAFSNVTFTSPRSILEDTRPQNQLSAAQEQQKGTLCTIRQGAFVALNTILMGVCGTFNNYHTLEQLSWGLTLKELRNLLPSFIYILSSLPNLSISGI
jgi:hypothetical protein